ncbi:MAG: gephyrin-like molybdotransferase Glp [Polyangiaceae bacterium]
MKSIQEALDQMMPAFSPVGVARSSIADAFGHFLAEDIVARFDLPPFTSSSMDGYAVRLVDVARASKESPKTLILLGESRTGGTPPPQLAECTAMRIFTGAVLPDAADAIVIQEDTSSDGSHVTIFEAAKSGAWIRRRGSDLSAGEKMLARGTQIRSGEIGILAAQGIGSIDVQRKPRVAILSTGDELRDIDEELVPGAIINSNAYALAAMIREAGCEPVVLPNVPDDLEKTIAALREGLAYDVLLTVGGVSVGDYDFVREAFDKVGIAAGFWKVRIKPGKPLIFGMHEKTPVIGLPGNPMSAMVTFEALVRPGLRKMLGDPKPFRMRHDVLLANDHRHATGRLELARARVAMQSGKLTATPQRLQDSGSLMSWVAIDALLLLAEDRATFSAGETVPALLLRDDTGSAASPFA